MPTAREVAVETFTAGLMAAQFQERKWAYSYVGSVQTPVGERLVEVRLPATFPYQHPWVLPLDERYKDWGRHQTAREKGALCLWADQGEGAWDPKTSAEDVLARISEWFERSDTNSWTPDQRPPDLQYSFPELRRSGLDRTRLMVTGSDWPPPPGPFGRFAVWESSILSIAANPTGRYAPVTEIDRDHALPKLLSESDVERRPTGVWFRPATEPRPQRTLGAMLEEIGLQIDGAGGVVRGVIGDKIRAETIVVLAVGYPDASSGEERWLFIDARAPEGRSSALAEMPLRSYEHAPADPATLMRRSGASAAGRAGKRVAIFGLGALGSRLAVTLARGGVGSFDLFDGDVLRPGNVIRHAASMGAVGLTKAISTSMAMKTVTPFVSTERHDTTWDLTEIDLAITRADLVVDATATIGFTLLLAERCIAAGRRLLWMTAQRAGEIGRVRLMRPRRDPCPQCHRPSSDAALEPAVPTLEGDETFVESGCGAPTSAASPAALEQISITAAQFALRMIDGTEEAVNEAWIVSESIPGGDPPLDTRGVHERALPIAETCALCEAE